MTPFLLGICSSYTTYLHIAQGHMSDMTAHLQVQPKHRTAKQLQNSKPQLYDDTHFHGQFELKLNSNNLLSFQTHEK